MSKKVIKGWVANGIPSRLVFDWHPFEPKPYVRYERIDEGLSLIPLITRARLHKSKYVPGLWPPRRVTITIEVDD